jgi:hypothetical protein
LLISPKKKRESCGYWTYKELKQFQKAKEKAFNLWDADGSKFTQNKEQLYLLVRNLFIVMPSIPHGNYSNDKDNWRRLLKAYKYEIAVLLDRDKLPLEPENISKDLDYLKGKKDWEKELILNKNLISQRSIVDWISGDGSRVTLKDKDGQWKKHQFSVFPKRRIFFQQVKDHLSELSNIEVSNPTDYWMKLSIIQNDRVGLTLEKDAWFGKLILGVPTGFYDKKIKGNLSVFLEKYKYSNSNWLFFEVFDNELDFEDKYINETNENQKEIYIKEITKKVKQLYSELQSLCSSS